MLLTDEYKVVVDFKHSGQDPVYNKVDINIHKSCPMTVTYVLFEISPLYYTLFFLCPLSLSEIILTVFRKHPHITIGVMIDTLLEETEQFLVSWPNKSLHPSGVNNLVSEVDMGKKINKTSSCSFPRWYFALWDFLSPPVFIFSYDWLILS